MLGGLGGGGGRGGRPLHRRRPCQAVLFLLACVGVVAWYGLSASHVANRVDLKIYVYDLPPKYNLLPLRELIRDRSKFSHYLHQGAEVYFHQRLINHTHYRTHNPDEADLFFVPLYSSTQVRACGVGGGGGGGGGRGGEEGGGHASSVWLCERRRRITGDPHHPTHTSHTHPSML